MMIERDMTAMADFSVFMLQALAEFLGSDPIFYLFGLICTCFVCRAVKELTSCGRR